MSKPIVHARSSARRFGGEPEDYLPIHDLMDSSKSAFPDNRHRALTHNNWFFFIVERIFGHEITVRTERCDNCQSGSGVDSTPGFLFGPVLDSRVDAAECRCGTKQVSVRDICEQHVLEDFGGKFIPTVSDYFEGMEFQPWMNNAIEGAPSSHRKLARHGKTTRRRAINLD